MGNAFRLAVDSNGIGRLVFDLPNEKINKLSLPLLEELEAMLDEARQNTSIKALLFTSAKEDIFIAGADLKSFDEYFKKPEKAKEVIEKGHYVFRKLETLPFPTIAVINGACFGGGLELALSCTYRIVGDNPKTQLGLPETTLGIFPGWGGTQRLPKLVGVTQALSMILSGKEVDAKKAFYINLVDALYPSEFLTEKTLEFLKECLSTEGREKILNKRKHRGLYYLLFEKNIIGRSIIYWKARRNVLEKTKGFYPAPLAALEVIKSTDGLSMEKGLEKEREMFFKAMEKEFRYAPNLIQIFFNSEAIKKDPGLPKIQGKAVEVKSAGVLGAGTMGGGIAWLMSYRDLPVRMKDINWEAVSKGYASSWDTYKTLIRIKKLKPTQANLKFHQLTGTVDYTGFDRLDLIIEAAVEDLELKHKIFNELEPEISSNAVIGTNTSSLTIKELGTALKHPERLVGMHFFNPPSRMPLVEVVAGEKTAPEAVHAAVELCRKLKKTPIVVRDCSGFLVNRVFARGFIEVLRMLQEGVKMDRLDKLLLKFGMPMAPFVLADEVGNDVNLKAFSNFERAYGSRMRVPEILEKVNKKGMFGKKTGKGFYLHKKKSHQVNPEIVDLLKEYPQNASVSDEEVVERVILAMINEASMCLEEGIVTQPGHLDLALVYGIGFPPFRGGLLRYADTLGLKQVVNKLEAFSKTQGDRYAPTTQLQEMAKHNKTFYP